MALLGGYGALPLIFCIDMRLGPIYWEDVSLKPPPLIAS